ncbi:protein prenylyltransferase [Lepidopterella palustris CBS 459.81]|uniref:Geranylgeranyl transferase type-2 subunit alpha n=1 Tax=Lepidopterella palustris CBS 459.81 TaxID=1314670 RepID=A0A8E2EFZ4_9PEZI|nr:protein prenylyltransferase [Lepidopterella palustris CBS 459.81]
MASHGVRRVTANQVRTEQARQKELQQITEYKDLVDLVNTKCSYKIAEIQYTIEVLALTTKLLTENPEYYTIWNHRRRILQQLFTPPSASDSSIPPSADKSVLDFVSDDLRFTFSLLKQFPKCYWIWNHRRWALKAGESLLQTSIARQLWLAEFELVGKMLRADSRNFHAWSYRRFVVAQLERIPASSDMTGSSTDADKSMVEAEFAYTTKMIKTNLSNFSAWHNRSKLIPRLLDQRQADEIARRKMFDNELSQIDVAINTDPWDQSIWYYHQFLMSTLSPTNPRDSAIMLELNNHDRLRYYEQEIGGIRDILEDETDCKWIYESLLQYAPFYLEIEGGTKMFTTLDMREWLSQLRRLDPLRKGRWDDLERSLSL